MTTLEDRTKRLRDLLNREPIYINAYTDFGFKKLFGEEANKDLLIDFLNTMLPQKHQIKDLTFKNPEKMPHTADDRKAFFDVFCESNTGESFIVEMQKATFKNFKDRALFYTTYPIQQQAKRGNWSFELKPVYFIAILDFSYEKNILEEEWELLREVSLRDQFGEIFSEKLNFRFVQMPCFNKKEEELVTHFDKWLYFLKNLEFFDKIPEILNEPIFIKGFETAKIAKMSKEFFTKYERSRIMYMENKAFYSVAVEEGREEGREETAILIAEDCLKDGFSIEKTAQLTRLPIETVHGIAKRLGLA